MKETPEKKEAGKNYQSSFLRNIFNKIDSQRAISARNNIFKKDIELHSYLNNLFLHKDSKTSGFPKHV